MDSPARLQRSFIDLRDEIAYSIEQHSILAQMGWKGALGWDELLKSRRILIISEAGAGKTHECRAEQAKLFAAGEAAFYFDLAELSRSNLRDLMSPEEEQRFDEWLTSQSDTATFFLDSIDELKLTLGSFESALKRLNKAIHGQLGRAKVVITTRPVPIDSKLIHQFLPIPERAEFVASGEAFADVAMGTSRRNTQGENSKDQPPEWRTVALMPLSTEQIREMAALEGVADPEALLQDIQRRDAEDFAQRPQDLIELCTDWRDHRRIRLHRDQVAYNIDVKLRPRLDPGEKAPLSAEQALEGASRLALAALLTRRLTLRHSAEADLNGAQEAALSPHVVLPDWGPEERITLLERSLFGFASYGRVRFHHQSVVEYLAAHRLEVLLGKGMPIRAVKRLLFAETAHGVKVVKPSMRPVAAWLALSQPSILEEILEREPEVLFDYGDPASLPPPQRARALRAYVEKYGQGGWRGMHVPRIQVHRFASEDLAPEVARLWDSSVENPEVRELLMELIAATPMMSCADIAFSVAMNGDSDGGERLDAIEALTRLNDPRLPEIVASLENPSGPWTNARRKAALLRLFPRHISAESLCRVLALVTESRRTAGDLGWLLSRQIESADVPHDYLEALRSGITELIAHNIKWESRTVRVVTPRKHLIVPLAAICLRLLRSGCTTDAVIQSSVVALKCARDDSYPKDAISDLKGLISQLSGPDRARVFWADDAFTCQVHPIDDPVKRWFEANYHGAISLNASQDAAWIFAALADKNRPPAERAVMLEAAMRDAWDGGHARATYLAGLKEYVSGRPELLERIDAWLQPAPISKETARLEADIQKRQKQAERRKVKNHASWVLFWRQVANNPQTAFSPDESGNTAWNLWRAMERSGEESRASGWSRRFIEKHFNKDIADRLRAALMTMWRKDRPTLRSERPDGERNTYLIRWQLGLAAIAAEAEDPSWARKLSVEEAELATRYAPIELNGFPSWLESLSAAHPSAVESVLGPELSFELDEFATPNHHSSLLQNINHAAPAVASIFLPRLRTWLDNNAQRLREGDDADSTADRVRRVAELVIKLGDDHTRDHVRQVAVRELSKGLDSPFSATWLPILMRLDPTAGIEALERGLSSAAPAPMGKGVLWFGLLFGDRQNEFPLNLETPEISPSQLLQLVRLAYIHVRPAEDVIHDSAFSPGSRDHAERARDALLKALLNSTGPEGWTAKLSMADDPLFSHFRDRALQIAREKAAEESDGEAFPDSKLATLDRYGEAPPLTRDEIFALLNDRLDDLEDLLLRDDSPRAAWAIINDEKIMRRAISRELGIAANHAYTVDQEGVTADEKETDIRLRSAASSHEAVIELKIGEKDRSGRELRDTIREQLVRKYMAPESCRAGCLLITVSSDRHWEHPDTGKRLDAIGLERMLQEESQVVMAEMGYSLRLTARVLDLRPRLPPER